MASILVVDDDKSVRDMLWQMLEKEGYEVSQAADAEQALTEFQEDEVDLVITDIFMPGNTGIDLIRELKQQTEDLKVIAITGVRGSFSKLPAAENVGAERTLMKPFTTEDIVGAIEELLEGE